MHSGGWINGEMSRWLMDGLTGRQTDKQINRQTEGQINKRSDRQARQTKVLHFLNLDIESWEVLMKGKAQYR